MGVVGNHAAGGSSSVLLVVIVVKIGWSAGIRLCPPIVGSVVIFPDLIQFRIVWGVTPRSRAAVVVVMCSGFMNQTIHKIAKNARGTRIGSGSRGSGEPEPIALPIRFVG